MAYESKGTTQFQVDGAPRTFKYAATVDDDKLRLWIEDTVTKRQWQTKHLAISDFVTIDTAIPQFKAKDYAVRVVECLAPSESIDGEVLQTPTSSLSKASADGSRVLCVAFSFLVLTAAVSLEYTFTLDEVALERTDLLEARIADLEVASSPSEDQKELLKTAISSALNEATTMLKQEIQELKRQLAEHPRKPLSISGKLHVESTTASSVESTTASFVDFGSFVAERVPRLLKWVFDNVNDASVAFNSDGSLVLNETGTYIVQITLSFDESGDIEIRINNDPRFNFVVGQLGNVATHVIEACAADKLSIYALETNRLGASTALQIYRL